MTTGSVAHQTFVIERLLKAPPRRVFRAWSDPAAKRRWTTSDATMTSIEFSLDFRPHGSEINRVIGPEVCGRRLPRRGPTRPHRRRALGPRIVRR
jgi:uncharacterized protein YndB with AHSA1/START domain